MTGYVGDCELHQCFALAIFTFSLTDWIFSKGKYLCCYFRITMLSDEECAISFEYFSSCCWTSYSTVFNSLAAYGG